MVKRWSFLLFHEAVDVRPNAQQDAQEHDVDAKVPAGAQLRHHLLQAGVVRFQAVVGPVHLGPAAPGQPTGGEGPGSLGRRKSGGWGEGLGGRSRFLAHLFFYLAQERVLAVNLLPDVSGHGLEGVQAL